MNKEYKMLFLKNGKIYVSRVRETTDETMTLINPMLVEYKFNAEGGPSFRYLPWQVLSSQPNVDINTSDILMSAAPKTELLDMYQRICISFIRVEDED